MDGTIFVGVVEGGTAEPTAFVFVVFVCGVGRAAADSLGRYSPARSL